MITIKIISHPNQNFLNAFLQAVNAQSIGNNQYQLSQSSYEEFKRLVPKSINWTTV